MKKAIVLAIGMFWMAALSGAMTQAFAYTCNTYCYSEYSCTTNCY